MAYRNLKKENCFDDKFKIYLDDWLKTVPDQPKRITFQTVQTSTYNFSFKTRLHKKIIAIRFQQMFENKIRICEQKCQ